MPWIARSACVIVAAPLVLAGCFTEAGDTGGDDDDTETGNGGSGTATDPSLTSTDPTLPGTAGTGPVTDTEDPDTTQAEAEAATATTDDEGALFCRDVDMMLPTAATACNDFEESGHEHGGWALTQTGGGVADVVVATKSTERGSVASTSFGDTADPQPEAFVVLDQGDPTLLTRLQFRMDVASCDGDVTFASMYFPDEVISVSLEHTVDGEVDLVIYDAVGDTTRYPLGVNIPADTGPWAKWEIRADLDEAYVDVLVDDDFVAQVTDFAPPEELTSAAAIRLGVARKTTGFACAIAFDDVVRY